MNEKIINVDDYIDYLESEECSRCRKRKSISFCNHCKLYNAMMLMYYVPKELRLDVEPVRHATWVLHEGRYHCSNCGFEAYWSWTRDKQYRSCYCADCGAKMEVLEDGSD